ncbi:hypothetical protein [Mycoplasmoides alvi]|uniref:hypothetical protein n=1 Tax=Mycoplasmoides alvi TaxID=78580 RepID=UPI00051B4194|nr:hypothetical protein [Mycoplasmoides alvi]
MKKKKIIAWSSVLATLFAPAILLASCSEQKTSSSSNDGNSNDKPNTPPTENQPEDNGNIPNNPNVPPTTNTPNIEPVTPNSKHDNTTINNLVDSKHLGLNDLTIFDAYSNLNSKNLNEYVFNNLKFFISGDVSLLKSANDISVKIDDNSNQIATPYINLEITILPNRWYNNNQVQITSLVKLVKIVNFKETPKSLESNGGQLIGSNLNATAYKNIIDLFGLNDDTAISSLTDQWFNNILQKLNEFSGLKIKILDGSSTLDGKLKLQLNGTYKDQEINNQVIEITGFKTCKSRQNFYVSQIELNKNEWFQNNLPIDTFNVKSEIDKITSEDWLSKYLLNFSVYDGDTNILIGKMQDLINFGLIFNVSGKVKDNKIEFTIGATYQNKVYDSSTNLWKNIDGVIEWTQTTQHGKSASIPNANDAKKYLIDQTAINKEELAKHYPSYYYGLGLWCKINSFKYFFQNNLIKNDNVNNIKNKYFNNQENFTINIDPESIYADDFRNDLSFDVVLYIGDQKDIVSKKFSFLNATKNINTLDLLNKTNNISINEHATGDTIFPRIKKELTKNKDKLDKLFNETSGNAVKISAKKNDIIPSSISDGINFNLSNSIDSIDSMDQLVKNVSNKFEQIKKSFVDVRVFNLPINLSTQNESSYTNDNTLNLYTQLFWVDKDTSFIIDSITFDFADNIELTISNIHDNLLSIQFAGKTNIAFHNASNIISLDTNYSFNLRKA